MWTTKTACESSPYWHLRKSCETCTSGTFIAITTVTFSVLDQNTKSLKRNTWFLQPPFVPRVRHRGDTRNFYEYPELDQQKVSRVHLSRTFLAVDALQLTLLSCWFELEVAFCSFLFVFRFSFSYTSRKSWFKTHFVPPLSVFFLVVNIMEISLVLEIKATRVKV